jgi:DNA polymerase-3 subunit alpha
MAGITFDYIEKKQSSLPPQYIHSKLKPVLSSTCGLVLYRKQVIEVAGCIAGYSQEEQYALKTTLVECKPGELSVHKNRFMDGAVSNLVDATTAEAIFKQIAYFSSYDFYDEWQASEHAILAYRSAYMRHCYPEDYQTALDNTRIDRNAEKETVVKAPEDLNPLVLRYIKAKLAGQQYQQKTSDQLSNY